MSKANVYGVGVALMTKVGWLGSCSFLYLFPYTWLTINRSTIELLIERKFVPTRTVVLAFGFDEEASGSQVGWSTVSDRLILRSLEGAEKLAKALEDTFGEDGFAFIVDEGAGFSEQYGSVFAVLAIAEKGSSEVKVEVATAGGHSSVPPPHTVSFSRYFRVIHLLIMTEHWHSVRPFGSLWKSPFPYSLCKLWTC